MRLGFEPRERDGKIEGFKMPADSETDGLSSEKKKSFLLYADVRWKWLDLVRYLCEYEIEKSEG